MTFITIAVYAQPETKIKTVFGPEDIVLDNISGKNDRIIISCAKYKGQYHVDGTIQFYYPHEEATEATTFKMKKDIAANIRPHGIAIAEVNGKAMLYVISHENKGENEKILVFKIQKSRLVKVDEFNQEEIPEIIHPNDLYVTDEGMLYYSNYPKSMTNFILKKKNGNIGYINTKTRESGVLIDKLPFPNGVIVVENDLYYTDTALGNLYKAPLVNAITPKTPEIFGKVKSGDNISLYNNKLIVASHPKPARFLFYMLFNMRSPSQVTSFDIEGKEAPHTLYDKSQKSISGSSTALIYKNDLYISQVKQKFILKRKLK